MPELRKSNTSRITCEGIDRLTAPSLDSLRVDGNSGTEKFGKCFAELSTHCAVEDEIDGTVDQRQQIHDFPQTVIDLMKLYAQYSTQKAYESRREFRN